jgi:putative copper export protein
MSLGHLVWCHQRFGRLPRRDVGSLVDLAPRHAPRTEIRFEPGNRCVKRCKLVGVIGLNHQCGLHRRQWNARYCGNPHPQSIGPEHCEARLGRSEAPAVIPSGEECNSLCTRGIGIARLCSNQFRDLLGKQRYPRIISGLDQLIERVAWLPNVPSGLRYRALLLAVTIGPLAWTGHGAASEGPAGTVQLIADIIHLLGAGAWLAALAALTLILFRSVQASNEGYLSLAHRLLKGFSGAGTAIVTLILGSGLVNSWMLVGPQNVQTLILTLYGQLLIAKLLLFGVMLILAAANRFILTPAFERARHAGGASLAFTKLRQSLAFELMLAIIIVGLVAWLGTLQPPATT